MNKLRILSKLDFITRFKTPQVIDVFANILGMKV